VKPGTVADLVQWLIGSRPLHEVTWPPDLFAVAASILQKSGAYPVVVERWPPGRGDAARNAWVSRVTEAAERWRATPARPPARLTRAVGRVAAQLGTPLRQIREDRALCTALLEICAMADEACAGVGIPAPDPDHVIEDPLADRARELLSPVNPGETTLCATVHPSKLRVLPKLHTPQSGMTLRSLTHHLALCGAGEVEPLWLVADFQRPTAPERLNLLVLPWPLTIVPSQFTAVPHRSSRLPFMPPGAYGGFFEYASGPESPEQLKTRVLAAIADARRMIGEIDGVVLPELAMTEDQRDEVARTLIAEGIFLLGGVASQRPPRNYLVFELPITGAASIRITQHKHHRWQLDRRQIIQYGLGACLDPTRKWWEHTSICDDAMSREVHFVALRDWLTITPLICEDLARQEPVGDLVRAVGPNLVIALLMDGPQLASRWPGRYATVLADDPGCSVLTVSSYGMVALCKPPPGGSSSRTVAMWKDAQSGEVVHIDLPQGKVGVVLTITRDWATEYSADGRSDDQSTGYPILAGVHAV
jgi:hypothetical protein